jgi:hypothetical protein
MEFSFVRLTLTLRINQDRLDPWLLYGRRSEFFAEFRPLVCKNGRICSDCPQVECLYRMVTGQELATNPEGVRRHQKPSLPFVIAPSPLPPKAGESGEVTLLLAGSMVNHWLLFVDALRSLIARLTDKDAVTIERIESGEAAGGRQLIWQEGGELRHDRLVILTLETLLAASCLPGDTLGLRFTTPLSLVQSGQRLHTFDPSLFLRTLLRRLSSLVYYESGDELAGDYQLLTHLSREVKSFRSRFVWLDPPGRQGRLAGLMGSCHLSGDLQAFHPILLLGEEWGVGKGASFGLGRFQVDLSID